MATFPSSRWLFVALLAFPFAAVATSPWPAEHSSVAVDFVVERGDRALLIGRGFTSVEDMRVSFGPLEAEIVRVIDGSRLEIRVPAAGAGRVDVCVSNANGASVLAEGFDYPSIEGDVADLAETPVHACWPHGTVTDAPFVGDSLDAVPEDAPESNEVFVVDAGSHV